MPEKTMLGEALKNSFPHSEGGGNQKNYRITDSLIRWIEDNNLSDEFIQNLKKKLPEDAALCLYRVDSERKTAFWQNSGATDTGSSVYELKFTSKHFTNSEPADAILWPNT